MSIALGNLSVEEIEERLGIEFPQEIRDFMNENHQSAATVPAKGKWHCYDIPFNIHCGDVETATKIYDSVKAQSHLCKQPLGFSIPVEEVPNEPG